MKIIQAYFTEHPCYNGKKRAISPVGILVHSTGAINPELRRYVDSEELLGRNQYNNHWNKPNATKSVHAFIGYDKAYDVIIAETLPHDIACWGAGKGRKGSYNYDPHAYLQFEICQGSNADSTYYWKVIHVAEEYCAHLCKLYGWTAENITSHAEAHAAGYANNHSDPQNWMKHFGDDMDKFRDRVQALLCGTDVPEAEPIPPTLRKGNESSHVKKAQELLISAGYDVGSDGADGKFGRETLSAVRAFQADHGLSPDGIIGPKTWAALDAAPAVRYSVTISGVTKTVAEKIVAQYGGKMMMEGDTNGS